jgi:hypothetical protein
MIKNSSEKRIDALEKRMDRLEKMFLKRKAGTDTKTSKKYEGLTGGIQLLINNGLFKKPVLVTEVNEELKREGYFYAIQAVDTILRRDLVKRKKVLNRVKIDGVWQYILRK